MNITKNSYWANPCNAYLFSKDLKLESVIRVVCEKYDITIEALKGKSRIKDVVEARQICFYILHKKMKLTSIVVGDMFNKNHATVLHSCRTIENFMLHEVDLKNRINNIITEIKIN